MAVAMTPGSDTKFCKADYTSHKQSEDLEDQQMRLINLNYVNQWLFPISN